MIGKFYGKFQILGMNGLSATLVAENRFDTKETAEIFVRNLMVANPGLAVGWVMIHAITPEKVGPYAGPDGEDFAIIYYNRQSGVATRSYLFVSSEVAKIADDAARENLGITSHSESSSLPR